VVQVPAFCPQGLAPATQTPSPFTQAPAEQTLPLQVGWARPPQLLHRPDTQVWAPS
jgi:hypothetical protein